MAIRKVIDHITDRYGHIAVQVVRISSLVRKCIRK